jgi:hypothetical protein
MIRPSFSPSQSGRLCFAALAAFTLLLLASSGFAVPLYYELASGSVTADTAEPGLVIGTMVKPTVPGTAFTIDNGASFTFSFFDIWTNEPTINLDDKVSSPITATLNFLDPFTGATVTGITVGGSWNKGLSQWGELTWDGPVTVTVPGDRTFQISLSDTTFNYGFGGLNEGMMCGATVDATITQISSQASDLGRPVPDGGKTALLLGTTLVGLRLLARNKRAVRD